MRKIPQIVRAESASFSVPVYSSVSSHPPYEIHLPVNTVSVLFFLLQLYKFVRLSLTKKKKNLVVHMQPPSPFSPSRQATRHRNHVVICHLVLCTMSYTLPHKFYMCILFSTQDKCSFQFFHSVVVIFSVKCVHGMDSFPFCNQFQS